MAKKKEKRLYKPPKIQDISGFSASGQDSTKGICNDGSALTFETCSDGDSPTGGNCNPTGIGPSYGYCDFGNNAVEGCTSGNGHF